MSQAERSTAARAWHPVHRIAFRFAFVYLILFALPGPIIYVPVLNLLGIGYIYGKDFATRWVARSVLGIERDLGPIVNGSGDRTLDYVGVFCNLALAAAVTVIWSAFDRRRTHHTAMHEGLRIFLRYTLALAMLSYGLAKMIPPTQFPSPGVDRLMETFGDASPMRLMWTFMGASQAYTFFGGLMEVIGGLLLFSRRTTTLGALVTAGVMVNVAMLNFCYDVPVKLYSTQLVLVAMFLTLPDVGRLLNAFVLNRATGPGAIDLPVTGKYWRIGWMTGKVLFVAFVLYVMVAGQLELRNHPMAQEPTGPLNGVYEVESFQYNGDELPPLLGDARRWQRVSIYGSKALFVRTMDDKKAGFKMVLDEDNRSLTLTSVQEQEKSFSWRYEEVDGKLVIEGHQGDAAVRVQLKKIDPKQFLLINRGFNWVNEWPQNVTKEVIPNP